VDADARISPDGSRIVYTHVNVTPKHDNYETALWIIPSSAGRARQLTSGPHDSQARWSPDGRLVAFLRSFEKDGRSQPAQIFLLSTDGGDARPLTDMPKGAGEPVWSPDSRSIAFPSTTLERISTTRTAPKRAMFASSRLPSIV
jgi:dipeptidyl aminopeptidase/acylaminoacyl peptidase